MNLKRLGKRGAVLTTALLLAASTAFSVWAAPFAARYTYSSAGYLFEKFSHPDSATQQPDGLVDYIGDGAVAAYDQGQGARGQSYSWAAIAYGDALYVSTNYASLPQTLNMMDTILGETFDKDVMAAELKALYNGSFFYGEEDGANTGGVLVKFDVNTGEMKVLMSRATTGQACALRNAVEYNGKLYFCGAVAEGTQLGYPSIWQVDPATDECRQVYTGFASAQEYYTAYQKNICVSIRGITEFNGYLIISCVGANGPYILASNHPWDGQDAFVKIASDEENAPEKDLFGYTAYHYSDSIYGGSIWEMVSYNGSLYVALCTGTPDNQPDPYTMQSFALIRGDYDPSKGTVDNPDSWTWTPVVGDKADGAKYTFGIDPERTRSGACNLVVYDGYLYIGEYNDEEIALQSIIFDLDFTFLARNLTQSANLYRMDADENMELVVGDATDMFPEGSLSGYGSGFGDHENQYIWQSTVWHDKLYLGTFDTSSLLEPLGQFVNGNLLRMSKEEWTSQLGYIRTAIQVATSKLADDLLGTNGPAADPAVLPTETEARALVQQAMADANSCWQAQQADAQENGEPAETQTIALTEDQVDSLVQAVTSGQLVPGSLSEAEANGLLGISQELDQCTALFDQHAPEALLEMYQDLNDKIEATNGVLKMAYRKLVNNNLLQNIQSYLVCVKYLTTAKRGFGMYVSDDGVHFHQITDNGFGDPYNHGLRVFASTDDYLFIGTANPFMGTQIWRTTQPSAVLSAGTEQSGSSNPISAFLGSLLGR